jgi:hypothetical protein
LPREEIFEQECLPFPGGCVAIDHVGSFKYLRIF